MERTPHPSYTKASTCLLSKLYLVVESGLPLLYNSNITLSINGYHRMDSTTVLYIQGVLLLLVSMYSLLDPENYVITTGDAIIGSPTNMLNAIRYANTELSKRF